MVLLATSHFVEVLLSTMRNCKACHLLILLESFWGAGTAASSGAVFDVDTEGSSEETTHVHGFSR